MEHLMMIHMSMMQTELMMMMMAEMQNDLRETKIHRQQYRAPVCKICNTLIYRNHHVDRLVGICDTNPECKKAYRQALGKIAKDRARRNPVRRCKNCGIAIYRDNPRAVSYTHLTLPTNREV